LRALICRGPSPSGLVGIACGALFGMGFDRFFLFIIFFFSKFVYELSHVGFYLGWDLSDFIYFLNLCVGAVAFSIFFFFFFKLFLSY
jgi:hypothetical protein